jgi:hypothetical protein
VGPQYQLPNWMVERMAILTAVHDCGRGNLGGHTKLTLSP